MHALTFRHEQSAAVSLRRSGLPVAVRRVRAWRYWQSGNVGPSVNVYVSVCRTVSRYGSAALESTHKY